MYILQQQKKKRKKYYFISYRNIYYTDMKTFYEFYGETSLYKTTKYFMFKYVIAYDKNINTNECV